MSPTIASLARFITQNGHLIDHANAEAQKAGDMLALLEKYSRDFPSRPGDTKLSPAFDRHVILVTGTTGGLGASVLAELVSLPNVRKVYALNRPSSKGKAIEARQKVALAARGLDESLVDSEKVVLIEGNLASPSLGLESALLDEVRRLDSPKSCSYSQCHGLDPEHSDDDHPHRHSRNPCNGCRIF